MIALRYVYVLALAVSLGGTVAVGGIAAPATFAALQQHDPASGRFLAGVVVGEVLRRSYHVAYVADALLLAGLAGMALLGPRPSNFAVRAGIATIMLALTLYAGVVLTGQIERLQREIGVSVASLPVADPRRVRFGWLHGLSTGLMTITAVGGLALLYWEAREH